MNETCSITSFFECIAFIHRDERWAPLGFIFKWDQIGAFEYNDVTDM